MAANEKQTKRTPAPPEARPHPHSLAGTLAEEAAVAAAMADRITVAEDGPVLHVPTTPEEVAAVGTAEQATVNTLLGADDPAPLDDGERYRRVLRWDGPLNTNERQGFDPMQPDMSTTNPVIVGPR